MRILLAYKSDATGSSDPYLSLLPIGLPYLQVLLRNNGYHSTLANFSKMKWRKIETLLRKEHPDVIGISQFTHNRFESIRLAELAKKINPDCCVVLGGPHATFRYEEILNRYPAIDAVVLGEGELTILELLETFSTKGISGFAGIAGLAARSINSHVIPKLRLPVSDLDALPWPADFSKNTINVDCHRQLEFISTARGCPASCAFCSSPKFWGKLLRFRSPLAIVKEIRYLRDNFGLIYFSLRDDTFTVDRERVIEFCQLLISERLYILWNCQSRVSNVDEELLRLMKQAGCECIQYGVESGSARILRRLDKSITIEQMRHAATATRRVGINLSIYLISGIPEETAEDLQATLNLIEVIKPDDGQVSPLAYYPGTAIFNRDVAIGRIKKDVFEQNTSPAVYVKNDDKTRRYSRQLLAKIEGTAMKNQVSLADIAVQQHILGYCHTTNIMAGELCEEVGDWGGARRWYIEITRQQPDNPWGWLMLGELAARCGDDTEATGAFQKLLELVPAHVEAYIALGELAQLRRDELEAKKYFTKAQSLNPYIDCV